MLLSLEFAFGSRVRGQGDSLCAFFRRGGAMNAGRLRRGETGRAGVEVGPGLGPVSRPCLDSMGNIQPGGMEAVLLLGAFFSLLWTSAWELGDAGSRPDTLLPSALVAACLLFAAAVGLAVPCHLVTGSLAVRTQPDVDPPSQKKGQKAPGAPQPDGTQAHSSASTSAAAPPSAHTHPPGSQIMPSSPSKHCDEGHHPHPHPHHHHHHHHQQQQQQQGQQQQELTSPVRGQKGKPAQQEQGKLHGLLGVPCAVLSWAALMHAAAQHAPIASTDPPHTAAHSTQPSTVHTLQHSSKTGGRVALAVEASVCLALWLLLSAAVPWLRAKCARKALQEQLSSTHSGDAALSYHCGSSAGSMPQNGAGAGSFAGTRGSLLRGHIVLAAGFMIVGLLALLLTSGGLLLNTIDVTPASGSPTHHSNSSSSNSSTTTGDYTHPLWCTSYSSAPPLRNCTSPLSCTQNECPSLHPWASLPAAAWSPAPFFPAALYHLHALGGSIAPLATHALLAGLPNTFTLGEALLLVQAALQALHSVATHAAIHSPPPYTPNTTNPTLPTIPAPMTSHKPFCSGARNACTQHACAQPSLPMPALSRLVLRGGAALAPRLRAEHSTAQHAQRAQCARPAPSDVHHADLGVALEAAVSVVWWACVAGGCVWGLCTLFRADARQQQQSTAPAHPRQFVALEHQQQQQQQQQQLMSQDHHQQQQQQQQRQQQQTGQAASSADSSAPRTPHPAPPTHTTTTNTPTKLTQRPPTAVSTAVPPVWVAVRVAVLTATSLTGLCWAAAELTRLAAWTLLSFLPGAHTATLAAHSATAAHAYGTGQCLEAGGTPRDAVGGCDGGDGGGVGMGVHSASMHTSTLMSRLCILGYWGVVLGAALVCQAHITHHRRWPLTAVRKGYHLLVLLLFVPILLIDPPMLVLSLAIAFAALLCLELARATRTPLLPTPVHTALHTFMSHFVDARDLGGPLFVTHMALLLGCAVPIWVGCSARIQLGTHSSVPCPDFSGSQPQAETDAGGVSAGTARHDGLGAFLDATLQDAPWLLLASAGLVTLGVGDTAASVIGSWCGRTRVRRCSKKTWEGLGAGAAAMLAAMLLLLVTAGLYGGQIIEKGGQIIEKGGTRTGHHWGEVMCNGGSHQCYAATAGSAHEGLRTASGWGCRRTWEQGSGGCAEDGTARCSCESGLSSGAEGGVTQQCQRGARPWEQGWRSARVGRQYGAGTRGVHSKHSPRQLGWPGLLAFWGDLSLQVLLSALLEALTQQLDNLVLPLWHLTGTMCMLARALPL